MFAAGTLRHPLLSASPARTDAIVASHERSRAFGLQPKDTCDFAAPMAADFKITLESCARLYAQAQPVMELLHEQIVDTGSMVLLADNKGTILRTVGNSTFMEQAARVALRPGVSWSESSKGTNAVGTALMLESEFIVHSSEHFINRNHFLTCSAAPIMDHSGNVVGVLDVSGDERSFHPHTLGLVKMSARNIENYWFCDNFSRNLRLHFHTQPELIGTVAEGIIAIGSEGRVLGVNRAGLKLLNTSNAALRVQGLGLTLGLSFANLISQLRGSKAAPLKIQCHDGTVLFARAHINDPDFAKSFATSSNLLTDNHPEAHSKISQKAPVSPEALDRQTAVLAAQSQTHRALHNLHHGDAHMQAVVDQIQRVLGHHISIMILGATGTGKEWLARAIHHESQRRLAPFVTIDCASIPEHLIETELFGADVSTGTSSKQPHYAGKLLQANGGTLFLDEIGDMPAVLQTRLLRVLQERSVYRLGAAEAIPIDIQLVCSTHRNVRAMVEQGSFREDLYYRLNGLVVKLPSLRERSDFAALCQSMLRQLSPHKNIHLNAALLQAIENFAWPGNLRQLSNLLRTAISMCAPGNEILLHHLSEDFREDFSVFQSGMQDLSNRSDGELDIAHGRLSNIPDDLSSIKHLQYIEVETIRKAVQAAGGNISNAAKQLNISRNTVYRKLKAADSHGDMSK
jgi:sigma-54 dependent transcriptional regulator, acetoin dehydrogenase operon transcriptional activator AcoR